MRIAAPIRAAASAALLVVACALAPGNVLAQSAASPAAPGASTGETAKPARTRKKASDGASRKEPTAGQMAARERQRKCAAEWKDAKAAGKTGSTKWPQYWSQCNTRLKEQRA
jgi:hypothetical protein